MNATAARNRKLNVITSVRIRLVLTLLSILYLTLQNMIGAVLRDSPSDQYDGVVGLEGNSLMICPQEQLTGSVLLDKASFVSVGCT